MHYIAPLFLALSATPILAESVNAKVSPNGSNLAGSKPAVPRSVMGREEALAGAQVMTGIVQPTPGAAGSKPGAAEPVPGASNTTTGEEEPSSGSVPGAAVSVPGAEGSMPGAGESKPDGSSNDTMPAGTAAVTGAGTIKPSGMPDSGSGDGSSTNGTTGVTLDPGTSTGMANHLSKNGGLVSIVGIGITFAVFM